MTTDDVPVMVAASALLAHERRLPVLAPLATLLPEGGLVRGRLVSTSGSAAVSLALALAAAPTQSGSWLGVVGFPDLGLAAAAELGVALERTVLVSAPPERGATWAEVVAALADGVDLVLLPASARLGERDARRVQQRLVSRGGVLIVVGGRGAFVPDLTLETRRSRWQGLGSDGAGHLTGRVVEVCSGGRRCGTPRRTELVLPAAQGDLLAIDSVVGRSAAPIGPSVATSWSQAG